jgi:hypothetical protein
MAVCNESCDEILILVCINTVLIHPLLEVPMQFYLYSVIKANVWVSHPVRQVLGLNPGPEIGCHFADVLNASIQTPA